MHQATDLSRTPLAAGVTVQPSRRQIDKTALAWCAAIFLLGFFFRTAFVTLRPAIGTDEPVNIAISLATTGRYADAYGPGVGPTAHTAPLHPLMLSVLFRIFGTGPGGVRAMSVLASVESSLAFALLPVLSIASGLGLRCGALAGVGGAITPVNFWNQTNGSFEAPLTAVFLVMLCILFCRVWEARSLTLRESILFGIVAGAACLTSPAIIPVLIVWAILSAVRFRQHFRWVAIFAGIGAALAIVMLSPWAVRNYRSLGTLIWTRSNFGLELQVSNNDLMTADLERNVVMPEFALFHPHNGARERARVKAMGEVRYGNAKLREALAWIAFHPSRFASLTAQRFALFWAPRMLRPWQTLFEAALSFAALAGLLFLFFEGSSSAWVFAAAITAYPPVYYLIQSAPRYRLPLEGILFLMAARALVWLTEVCGAGAWLGNAPVRPFISDTCRTKTGSAPSDPSGSSDA
jgi:hypothetical protein